MTITIEKETDIDFPIDYEAIANEIILAALDFVECPFEAEINVLLTDNEGIHQMNQEFRQIDRPTDVLSFPLVDYEVPQDFSIADEHPEEYFNAETGELMLGDIVISVEKVFEQAESFGHSIKREYAFLIAHSMLHLCGYDHMEEQERIEMEQKQEEILIMRGYTRDIV